MLKIANHCHYHKKLAHELILAVKDYPCDEEFLLRIEDDSLSLCSRLRNQDSCFTHSFVEPRLLRRASQKNQALLKACNNKKGEIHSVLDLTAGWGKDSFMLASHGQSVTMIEQNPLIASCLNYLVSTAQHDREDELYHRLAVINGDSTEYLSSKNPGVADCLYLDPMFPAHKSSAKPSKELQMLQILTRNRHIEELLELAIAKAGFRVVVKRPIHAPTLSDRKPDIEYREKTIRFDVYLTQNR